MTREEFIKLAVSSGYGTKSAAEHYVEQHDKSEYTTDDFIELYHTSMHWNGVAADKGLLPAHGVNGRTTLFGMVLVGIPGADRTGGDGMKKKTPEQELKEICESILRERNQWNYINEYGCNDPF